MVEFKVLTGTLNAGEDTITFTDSNINNNSIIEVYTNDYNVYPESIAQSENELIITFNASLNPVLIKVLINNIQNILNTPITKLNELVDVAATLLEDGYILVWDANMNTWIPEELPESGASTWQEVSNKPFESIGSGLSVDNGVLKATEQYLPTSIDLFDNGVYKMAFRGIGVGMTMQFPVSKRPATVTAVNTAYYKGTSSSGSWNNSGIDLWSWSGGILTIRFDAPPTEAGVYGTRGTINITY